MCDNNLDAFIFINYGKRFFNNHHKDGGIIPGEWESKFTNFIDRAIVIRKNIDRGFNMKTVTISSKYQVVIPKIVREALRLHSGQKMQVVEYGGRIELIPERDIKELRGFLKGKNTKFERKEDRI
jgi:AbrB family looped-hinge helix DNA binding protein